MINQRPETKRLPAKPLPLSIFLQLLASNSWGNVDFTYEQVIYSEATMALPLVTSYACHRNAQGARIGEKVGHHSRSGSRNSLAPVRPYNPQKRPSFLPKAAFHTPNQPITPAKPMLSSAITHRGVIAATTKFLAFSGC
jgi:hypothetical protein